MIQTINNLPKQLLPKDRVIQLNPYQDKFIFSKARYPALVSSWGTGKTMCMIEKIRLHAEQNKNNLSLIVRKEFTDLRDSTIKDWEQYTGIKVNSNREAVFPNGSIVMFRHAEELHGNNLNNINLGSCGIEQAEEFDTDEVMMKLRGRLRRANVEGHFLCVIANTKGHNWIYKRWKANSFAEHELIEANSFDNAHNLPNSTIEDWKRMKIEAPKVYNRFVLNSWEESDTESKIISNELVDKAKQNVIDLRYVPIRRIIGVDVSRSGKDKTIAYALENGTVLDKLELSRMDNMETVGRLLIFAEKNKHINNFAVDEIGVGAGVVDRLKELGKNVIPVQSASKSANINYKNIRAEVYGNGLDEFQKGNVSFYGWKDEDLFEQLTWSEWKDIDSTGVLLVEKKEDIVERYGRSPDNADAFLYGLWGLKFVKIEYGQEKVKIEGWVNPRFAKSYSV